jgi:hypothetical protein
MAGMLGRMVRAARLDSSLYEEVEADRGALGQAIGVVVLGSVASGVGSGGLIGVTAIAGWAIRELIVWSIWAALTYLIGAKLLPEPQTRADMGELLRTIGFANAPCLLRIFGLIPGAAPVVFGISGIWRLAAMVVAVRQALDYSSTWRALIVCLIGFLIDLFTFMVLVWFLLGAGGLS